MKNKGAQTLTYSCKIRRSSPRPGFGSSGGSAASGAWGSLAVSSSDSLDVSVSKEGAVEEAGELAESFFNFFMIQQVGKGDFRSSFDVLSERCLSDY